MNDKLIIIYYHEVVEKGQGFSYQKIEKDKFEAQMQYLRDQGYHSVLFSELSGPLPEKPIIVSFDDGFRTVYENAAPIMARYGIRGNVYLPTAYIGTDDHFMTWEMVSRLTESGQFEMQAHTHTHRDLRLMDEAQMRGEIARSDDCFRAHSVAAPTAFCMPFGTYDRRSIAALRHTGRYSLLLGSSYGTVQPGTLTRRILPRIGISNDDSLLLFQQKLEGKRNWKGPLQRLRLHYYNLRHQRIDHYDY